MQNTTDKNRKWLTMEQAYDLVIYYLNDNIPTLNQFEKKHDELIKLKQSKLSHKNETRKDNFYKRCARNL